MSVVRPQSSKKVNMSQNPWLLPAGFEDILPARAERIETLRRSLLDLYKTWGYQQVIPPMLDHLETLLTGVGQELQLQTMRLVDQESGRALGLRADMTPQVARIDAHRFRADQPNRLCYAGTVLRAGTDHYGGSRAPFQIGAELFGAASPAADMEVASLMIESLHLAGFDELVLDLGHVGIFRDLLGSAVLEQDAECDAYLAMQRKAQDDLQAALVRLGLADGQRRRIASLLQLHGGSEVIFAAREQLAQAGPGVAAALDGLGYMLQHLQSRFPSLEIQIDLAELRGYRYHTGAIFSVYGAGQGSAIGMGGRYDDIGAAFGHGRPATGFSLDLKQLVPPGQSGQTTRIWAPAQPDVALQARVDALRAAGEIVIHSLDTDTTSAYADAAALGCQQALVAENGNWVLVPVA